MDSLAESAVFEPAATFVAGPRPAIL